MTCSPLIGPGVMTHENEDAYWSKAEEADFRNGFLKHLLILAFHYNFGIKTETCMQ